MEAKELRIGNWVQHEPYPDEKWQIDFKLLESIDLQLVECVGIPLTPEILEKAGFDYNAKTNHSWLNIFEGYVSIGHMFNKFPLVLSTDGNNMPLHHITSLHQLQNLYFSLTGEELNVQL
jgi:hypothetical protein